MSEELSNREFISLTRPDILQLIDEVMVGNRRFIHLGTDIPPEMLQAIKEEARRHGKRAVRMHSTEGRVALFAPTLPGTKDNGRAFSSRASSVSRATNS